MIDVDALVGEFRAEVPEPPMSASAGVVRSCGVARRNTARVAVAATVAVALTAGLASLFVRSDPRGAIAPVTVSWGQVMTFRVVPDPGVDLETAVSGAIRSLRHEASRYNIGGVQTRRLSSNKIEVRLPTAEKGSQFGASLLRLALYDESAVVASGGSLRELTEQLESTPRATRGGTSWALDWESREGPERIQLINEPLGKAWQGGSSAYVFAYPADLTLVREARNGALRVMLLRGMPVASGPEIAGVRFVDDSIVADLVDPSVVRARTRGRAEAPKLLGVVLGPGPGMGLPSQSLGTATLSSSAAPLAFDRAFILRDFPVRAARFGTPNLGGRLTLNDYRDYGPGPLTTGLPTASFDDGKLEAGDRFVETARIGTSTGVMRTIVHLRNTRAISTSLAPEEGDRSPVGLTLMAPCPVGLGLPAIGPRCLTAPVPGDIRRPSDMVVVGRVRTDVATLDGTIPTENGGTEPIRATVSNGFYMLAWRNRSTDVTETFTVQPTLTARDRKGKVIGTVTLEPSY